MWPLHACGRRTAIFGVRYKHSFFVLSGRIWCIFLNSQWGAGGLSLASGRRPETMHSVRLAMFTALLMFGFVSESSATPLLQAAATRDVVSAVQGASSPSQSSAPQNPQNPPPPPETNPTPPGERPAPSGQIPTPAAQSPEPAIKNPEIRPAPTPKLAPPSLMIPRLARAPVLEDFLAIEPQGEAALATAKVTGFVQRNPHDGEKVTEPTAAYLGYDQKNLYVVFVCFDDPRKVRARMSSREDIYDDDQVEIMLDTFHDRRRAYAFQTTPLGVQWDAIWTETASAEVGNWDTSFDTVWDSRGKITAQGYVAWMAIPFKSLRFPPSKQQEWGIVLYRGIVRKNEDAFWPAVSRRVQGRLGQAATLYGLEGISPGRDIELMPYGIMRGFRGLNTV